MYHLFFRNFPRQFKNWQKHKKVLAYHYFAKRLGLNTGIARVQASVAGKKGGACRLARDQLRALTQTTSHNGSCPDLSVCGWLPCFMWKPWGEGAEILSIWLEFYVRRQCKGREFFLWPRPAKSLRWLIIIALLAELGGSDWLVISFMGGEGA